MRDDLTPWERIIRDVIFCSEESISVDLSGVCELRDTSSYVEELVKAIRRTGRKIKYRELKAGQQLLIEFEK
jgi:hypothetical protein